MVTLNPLLSIIVPVHNLEPFLKRCLNSILAQTFTDFELIVIDDGSTDQSPSICEAFAKNDERVIVLHTDHEGVSRARNRGIRAARGAYIGFVDGDDYIDPDMYQLLYQSCLMTGSDIGVCRLVREIDGQILYNAEQASFYTIHLDHLGAMWHLFKGMLYRFSLCNKLFKRSCFKDVYFPEDRIHEDLATTYRLFARANQTIYVHYPGYIYVKRANSILTTDYHIKRLESFLGWDEILPFIQTHYPSLKAVVYARFAYHCVDHAYYILHQVDDRKVRKSYLSYIQDCIKKHAEAKPPKLVLPQPYRSILATLKVNVHLFILANQLKQKIV